MNEIMLELKSLAVRLAQGDFDVFYETKNVTWLTLGAIVCVLLLVVRMLTRPRSAPVTEAERIPFTEEEMDRALRAPGQNGVFGWFTDALAGQLPEGQKERSEFQKLLRQAGLYSRTARVSIYALRFVLMFVPMTIAAIIALLSPQEYMIRILVVGGILAGTLSILPRLYVFFRRGKRLTEIREGISDMMDMLSMCLSGGMPLSPSLDHVAQNLEAFPALAEELTILKRQAEVGSLKRALADFADRVDLPQVRQVAGLLARGEQLGSRLSASLLDQADHFRSTRRQLATMQANKTPVILTLPLMFCFAPAVLILLMAPTLLQLTEFLRPTQGDAVLDGNTTVNIGAVTRTMDGLEQNVDLNRQWRRLEE
jgi:tight adherence protein C